MRFTNKTSHIFRIVFVWLACWAAAVLSIIARPFVMDGFMDCGDPNADFLYAPCAEGLRLLIYRVLGFSAYAFFLLPVFLTVLIRRRQKNLELIHIVDVSGN
jgi:hypothetical protein